jgi:hypothetical protein
MRCIFLIIFLCSSLYTYPPYLYAHDELQSENYSNPCFKWCDVLHFGAGYLGDFIFDREMEYRQGGSSGGVVQDTLIFSQGITLAVEAAEWIRFTAFLGSTEIEITTPAEANRFDSVWSFEPSFSWSLDLTTTLIKWGPYSAFFSGAYFRTETLLKEYYDIGGGSVFTFEENGDATYYNWQLSLGAAYELKTAHKLALIPYAALKYSGALLSLSGEVFEHEGTIHIIDSLQNRKTLGYGLGCRAKINEQFLVGIENRLADDRAVMVYADFIF